MRSISSLLIGTALLLAANGLLATSLGIRLTEETSLGVAGAVVSCASVGLAIGAWKAHRVIERVGHIRAFAAFSAIVAAVTVAMALLPWPALWTVLRVVQGFAMGGNYLVIESWLGTQSEPSERGRVLGAYILTCQVALAGGQLLVGVTPSGRGEPILLAALLYALGLVPVALTRTTQPALPEPSRAHLHDIARRAPVAVAGCFVAGATTGMMLSLGAPFATALGLGRERVAVFMALLVIGGLVLQIPLGRLADRIDRRVIVELLALSTVAISSLFLLPSHVPGVLEGVAFAFGCVAFVVYPVSVAHAHDLVRREDAVAASGTMVLAYASGSALVPLLGAGALELLGPRVVPLTMMALNLALGVLAVFRLRHRRRLPVRQTVPVVPLALPMVAPAAELEQAPEGTAR